MLSRALTPLLLLSLLGATPLPATAADEVAHQATDQATDQATNEATDEAADTPAPHTDGVPLNARKMLSIEWRKHAYAVNGESVTLSGKDGEYLSVESQRQTGTSVRLLEIKAPPLKSRYYAIKGEVRHRSVTGPGYLELVSEFDGVDETFSTRTQAEFGPMKRIEGRSRWRTFWIPFDADKVEALPDHLTLQLVLASVGVVEFSDLELYEFDDAESMWAVATPGDTEHEIICLSRPERRVTMAFSLAGIGIAIGGIHLLHLRRERRAGSTDSETEA